MPKVVLAPLMVVAGDHAINDMSGDDDSWQQVFEAAGYETQVVLKGLGEYPSIRKIYLETLWTACRNCQVRSLCKEKRKYFCRNNSFLCKNMLSLR